MADTAEMYRNLVESGMDDKPMSVMTIALVHGSYKFPEAPELLEKAAAGPSSTLRAVIHWAKIASDISNAVNNPDGPQPDGELYRPSVQVDGLELNEAESSAYIFFQDFWLEDERKAAKELADKLKDMSAEEGADLILFALNVCFHLIQTCLDQTGEDYSSPQALFPLIQKLYARNKANGL